MKCSYCRLPIRLNRMDWGYMFDQEQVIYAHIVCVMYDQEMERIETEDYLTSVMSF